MLQRYISYIGLFVLLVCAVVSGEVLELTDKNFDEVVIHSGKTTFVKFYATWCSHCKRMQPAFEELSESYAKNSQIQVAQIDADTYSKIGKRYDIDGFPTMKLFKPNDPKTPIDYSGARDFTSMSNFIATHTGVKPPKPETKIVPLDDYTLDNAVAKSDVFVALTASWCGHCKNLHPVWEKLAKVFEGDKENVVIAEVLTSDSPSEALKQEYNVQGFPTILYIPKGQPDSPIEYQGGRTLLELIAFVNTKANLFRDENGKLTGEAGVIPSLSELASTLLSQSGDLKQQTADEMHKKLAALVKIDPWVKNYYSKIVGKVLNGEEAFIEKETARLSKMIVKSESIAQPKLDSMQKRLNILKTFKLPDIIHEDL